MYSNTLWYMRCVNRISKVAWHVKWLQPSVSLKYLKRVPFAPANPEAVILVRYNFSLSLHLKRLSQSQSKSMCYNLQLILLKVYTYVSYHILFFKYNKKLKVKCCFLRILHLSLNKKLDTWVFPQHTDIVCSYKIWELSSFLQTFAHSWRRSSTSTSRCYSLLAWKITYHQKYIITYLW